MGANNTMPISQEELNSLMNKYNEDKKQLIHQINLNTSAINNIKIQMNKENKENKNNKENTLDVYKPYIGVIKSSTYLGEREADFAQLKRNKFGNRRPQLTIIPSGI